MNQHSRVTPADISIADFNALSEHERQQLLEDLMKSGAGRRWIRENFELDTDLADRLLVHSDDFTSSRRDPSLARAVENASVDALELHAASIAAGSAAQSMWNRLSEDPACLEQAAKRVLSEGDKAASRATVGLLVLDPLDALELGNEVRSCIAVAALDSADPGARSIAVEFLATEDAASLSDRLYRLALDPSPGVRVHAWSAAFTRDPDAAHDHAIQIIGDEEMQVEIRRSALQALGSHQPTDKVEAILSYFVVHHNRDLALDAATLFHGLHRSPDIATAAIQSPHEEVREIAQRLMDPFRGSPAAGGSRPGDPTGGDAYARMLRMLEDDETEE